MKLSQAKIKFQELVASIESDPNLYNRQVQITGPSGAGKTQLVQSNPYVYSLAYEWCLIEFKETNQKTINGIYNQVEEQFSQAEKWLRGNSDRRVLFIFDSTYVLVDEERKQTFFRIIDRHMHKLPGMMIAYINPKPIELHTNYSKRAERLIEISYLDLDETKILLESDFKQNPIFSNMTNVGIEAVAEAFDALNELTPGTIKGVLHKVSVSIYLNLKASTISSRQDAIDFFKENYCEQDLIDLIKVNI
jgi:hypothetical protein